MINEFKGKHRFLSNFWEMQTPMEYQGISYRTVEHFYVAMKTTDRKLRRQIAAIPKAGDVKKFGLTIELRKDWESIKKKVMLKALRFKFSLANNPLRILLIETYGRELIEGNYWNDTFWGFCLKTNKGKNFLGRMLMKVRQELVDAIPCKLLISGGRDYKNQDEMIDHMNELLKDIPDEDRLLVCGMARGADILAYGLAKANAIPVIEMPADWEDMSEPCVRKSNHHGVYNALAGMKRNTKMAELATHHISFHDGISSGTADMIATWQKQPDKAFTSIVYY